MNRIAAIALLAIVSGAIAGEPSPYLVIEKDVEMSDYMSLMFLDSQAKENESEAEGWLRRYGVTREGARALVQYARKSKKEQDAKSAEHYKALCADKESLRYNAFPLAARFEAMEADNASFTKSKTVGIASILSAADLAAFRRWKKESFSGGTRVNTDVAAEIRAGRLESDQVIARACDNTGS